MQEPLTAWLAAQDEEELAALLRRRPDVLRGPELRDLHELAERLSHPASLHAALSAAPLPLLQVAEALVALGANATTAALPRFLSDQHAQFVTAKDVTATGVTVKGAKAAARGAKARKADAHEAQTRGQEAREAEHEQAVTAVLSQLTEIAVAWVEPDGRIATPSTLTMLFPDPLELDQPLEGLLGQLTADALRKIQHTLGLPRQDKNGTKGGTKAAVLDVLVEHLRQPETVRSIVSTAPPDVAAELERIAWQTPDEDDEDLYDPRRAQLRITTGRWALERGIMLGHAWDFDWRMPSEVALALRGPDYRAPFLPSPPPVHRQPVDPAAVESESAVAATAFADHALSVLDHLVRKPAALLKSGGVGARELGRLAKAVGGTETEVRLVLELAGATALLDQEGPRLAVSPAFAPWRASEPGVRLAVLLSAWWQLGVTPTEARDGDGKTLPALAGPPPCQGCRAARTSLVEGAAQLARDESADRARLVARVRWVRPLVHVAAADGGEPLATVWREAQLLGVIAHGALTELGRALLTGSPAALAERATLLLPQTSGEAVIGADLTAMVIGSPSAEVSALLDSTADRESRGGATMWRISPESVRRAMDDGASAAELEAALASIATRELPQPLRYLIADVGRRHGQLRVSPAVSVIRGEDAALLAEASVDRRLRKLGLRLLAPTVLASDEPADVTLTALRQAGYLPMPEGEGAEQTQPDGIPTSLDSGTEAARSRAELKEKLLAMVEAPRAARGARASGSADPGAVASRLVGRRSVPAAVTSLEGQLTGLSRRLDRAQVRQLAHAIEHELPVVIDYESANGGLTTREISDLHLIGGSIYAWCELRQDDRIFTVARINSVSPLA